MIRDEATRRVDIAVLCTLKTRRVAQRVRTYRGARPIGTTTDSRVPTTLRGCRESCVNRRKAVSERD